LAIAGTNSAANLGSANSTGLLPAVDVTGNLLPGGNVLGTPDSIRNFTDGAPTATGDFVTAATKSIGAQKYFVVGPKDLTGTVTTWDYGGFIANTIGSTPVLKTDSMKYTVNNASNPWQYKLPQPGPKGNPVQDNNVNNGITVLLRRLANPHLPPQSNPTQPLYNPYITVDYMHGVVPQDAAKGTNYSSSGKKQPYAADPSQVVFQSPPLNKPTDKGQTFGSQNIPNKTSNQTPNKSPQDQALQNYDWLVHLDRQLVNPLELLHVSGYHPHELTHQFILQNPDQQYPSSTTPALLPPLKGQHRVNWSDGSNRLFRIFDHLGTHDRMTGVSPGGRVPGLVNINTIWDLEVFQALCDAQTGGSNQFSAQDVLNAFTRLQSLRNGQAPPNPLPTTPSLSQITANDRPFLGLGVGNYPKNDPSFNFINGAKATDIGIEDTLLRSANGTATATATDPRMFEVVQPNTTPPPNNLVPANMLPPYQANELMTKIYGNVTTRSNVFAVWCTVGFFRVADDSVRPVKLAEEIGAATQTNVRRRFFAVIDRSKLTIGSPGLNPPSGTNKLSLMTAVTIPNPPSPTSGTTNWPMTVQISTPNGGPSGTTNVPNGATSIPWIVQPAWVTDPTKGLTLAPWPQGSPTPTLTVPQPTVMIIDYGTPNEETVIADFKLGLNSGTLTPQGNPPYYFITATFQKQHPAGALITIPGNPGPQPTFDVNAGGVVLAYAVLE
jgi:hypothetical protein